MTVLDEAKIEIAQLQSERDFWFEQATRERSTFMKWWVPCSVIAAAGWLFLAGALMEPRPREVAVRLVGRITIFLSVASLIAAEIKYQCSRYRK